MILQDLADYLRLILYPLTMLGFAMQIANEYSGKRDWRRILVLLGTVLLLAYLMIVNILTAIGADIGDIALIRDAALTPIILFLCVSIWAYIIKVNRAHQPKPKEYDKVL
jgi:glucose-6-phosphate-specific signal transduction histidine kinase